jgi:CRP-like cAMP-binding protein
MSLAHDIDLLAKVPVFEGMNDEQLRLIAFGTEKRRLSAGQVLFKEYSPAECAYIITNGTVELSVETKSGSYETQYRVGKGVMLSELALFTLCERKYTAIALDDVEVFRITRIIFHRLVEEYPEIGQLVIQRIQNNIAELASGAASMQHRFMS